MQHYFDDSSLLRQVVGHRATGLSGPRALLLMAAHPGAFAGLFAHPAARAGPHAALTRPPRQVPLLPAHPVAFAGFSPHPGALADPYARLMRPATVRDAVAFGPKARAD